jgi:hypothetical protein
LRRIQPTGNYSNPCIGTTRPTATLLRYLPTYHESDNDECEEAECSNKNTNNTNNIIEIEDKHNFEEDFDEWEGIPDEDFEEWEGIPDEDFEEWDGIADD